MKTEVVTSGSGEREWREDSTRLDEQDVNDNEREWREDSARLDEQDVRDAIRFARNPEEAANAVVGLLRRHEVLPEPCPYREH